MRPLRLLQPKIKVHAPFVYYSNYFMPGPVGKMITGGDAELVVVGEVSVCRIVEGLRDGNSCG